MNQWNGMTIKELKFELKQRNLILTGNKPDLIKRLENSDVVDGELIQNRDLYNSIKNLIVKQYISIKNIPFSIITIVLILLIGM